MALFTTLLVGLGLLALRRFAIIHIVKYGCCARGCFNALLSANARYGMCDTCYGSAYETDWESEWERMKAIDASPFGRLKARCRQTYNRQRLYIRHG